MGIATSAVTQAETVRNKAINYFTTDAVAAVATTFVFGFKPRTVKFVNLTDRITDEWWEGMAADSALHTVAAGARTLVASGGITVDADGTVTIPAALMVASKSFVLMAEM